MKENILDQLTDIPYIVRDLGHIIEQIKEVKTNINYYRSLKDRDGVYHKEINDSRHQALVQAMTESQELSRRCKDYGESSFYLGILAYLNSDRSEKADED
tara:strand:- start:31913 stop:32212 length:300 start_codon:yes stop_codon:yes gene_type:complete